jgi:predicted ATPase
MIHLKSIQFQKLPDKGTFPFNLPVFESLEELRFENPVTLLVGENGTGKSTLLEGVACAAELIVVGSEDTRSDFSLSHARELSKFCRLFWTKRTHRGFFLRAEDFFGYAKQINKMRSEMELDLQEIDEAFKGRSDFARELAKMSTASGLADIRERYGEGLDARSHGESFMTLFQSRFVPGGLYMLDEPEAPLSPLRQLALITAIKDMVSQNGQFIIATHSPILIAFPDATILDFDGGKIHHANYNELEQVRLMRDFLLNPESYLRYL